MPYSSNAELPAAVRSSLSDKDQDQFREAFNAALQEYKDEKTAFKVAWAAVRKSADCRSFEFWANVGLVDKQHELTDQKVLFDEIAKFIERGGQMQAQHSNHSYASVVDHELREYSPGVMGNYCYGVVFKGDEFYDRCWDALKKGELSEFSIGGFRDAVGSTIRCDEHRCFNVLKMRLVTEISGVPKGACPQAKVTEFNAVAKSDPTSFFSQGADEMVSKCPRCAGIYQVLLDSGVPEAVAKEHLAPLAKAAMAKQGEEEHMTEQDQEKCDKTKDIKKDGAKSPKEEDVNKLYRKRGKSHWKDETHSKWKDTVYTRIRKDASTEAMIDTIMTEALMKIADIFPEADLEKATDEQAAEPVSDGGGPQPKATLEDKVNQLFALVSDMAHKVDELSTKFAAPEAPKPNPPEPNPVEQPPEQKPEAPVQKTDADLKDAVAKAAEIKADEIVRKEQAQAAVANGIVTPRPVPDEVVEKSLEERVRGAGFGSKELMSLSYEDTLKLSRQRTR